MIRDSGFTMIEVIVSLVLFGIIALVAGMGIVSFAKGYVFTRDSTHMAQKAQLAMARLNREFMEITNIAAKDDTQPDPLLRHPYVIYDNISGRHAIAKDGNVIKMFFNLPSAQLTLPPTGDNTLIDNVDSLTLSYYRDFLAGQTWVLGTDDMDLLTAIRFDLTLIGVGGNFSTVVYPRNIPRNK